MAPQKGEIRLFENGLLERLSKISPVTVLAVYLPVIIFAVWKSFAIGIPAGTFAILYFCGTCSLVIIRILVSPLCFSLYTTGRNSGTHKLSVPRSTPPVSE
jgi:hypothetical protein